MTNHEKAKQRAERVRQFRQQGLCIDGCGRTVGTNNDGTTSVRCDPCKVPPARRKINAASLKDTKYPRPKSDDWGGLTHSYFDDAWFKQLCEQIKGIIHKHPPVTSREIKAYLGDSHDPRKGYTENAIGYLQGEIESVLRGSMTVYVLAGEHHRAANVIMTEFADARRRRYWYTR